MRQLRLLLKVVRKSGADRIALGFVGYLLLTAVILWRIEPSIETFRESIWYCFVSASTIGFGDIVATTVIGRVLTIVLVLYFAFILAITTGVVVNYYNEFGLLKERDTLSAFFADLERLPELPKERLQELACQVRRYREHKED